jgi:hypothetical protein
MSFLRRLLGGSDSEPGAAADAAPPHSAAELDALERERELELLRADHERLDELQQRQLRYASYVWQPPAQGGEKRAEDNDPPSS